MSGNQATHQDAELILKLYDFRREADVAVCARTPEPFYAVGLWYEDFSQTTDDEVRELLQRAAKNSLAV